MKLIDQISKVSLSPSSSTTPAILNQISKHTVKIKIKLKEKK
jgi:hypothetical protein